MSFVFDSWWPCAGRGRYFGRNDQPTFQVDRVGGQTVRMSVSAVRVRRIGLFVALLVCGFPVAFEIYWGGVAQLLIDGVTILMGIVLFTSLLHMVGSAWTRTWHV